MGPVYCRGLLPKALNSRFSTRLLPVAPQLSGLNHRFRRRFHSTPVPWGIRSQVLKDVGEGITEVQIIQWYVEEGARIEEWKPLCQYQSDKAVDDITSRYEGVIKKLHFQADDTVPTGMALCDIEVDDAQYPAANAPAPPKAEPISEPTTSTAAIAQESAQEVLAENSQAQVEAVSAAPKSKYATFATPAVRGLLKEHGLDISQITGTGKDGRVMKEDVFKYMAERDSQGAVPSTGIVAAASATPSADAPQIETSAPLSPIQSQMFKTMTKSLAIPHFLYADELSISTLSSIRRKLLSHPTESQKISYLPFIIKAVSLALQHYPLLNSRVDTTTDPNKPALVMRSNHNIGVAIDTPTGLLVPNIKNVQARSILDIAAELTRLSTLARAGKLTPADLSGGTITVSNIGTVGGTYVAPVIVPTEVAILGIGKARAVPVFDAQDNVVKDQKMTFSWSADHRVVDGATMARMAEKVRMYLESPETMMLALR
ncbi:2-oxoacid dehydrogenase acyltransferase [Emydomyces testavorans]|uniref:Dihydrolipoamide acetyltransferase component of pyruvate dehydrogenase complex n=1 Tax=Emydomyces testavorans TaxID=2070801 RepID=A0AAF0INC9_9EURO|nr:2-oxoacid dehydrogenase acyltransferase [Emydomyces testavorans]